MLISELMVKTSGAVLLPVGNDYFLIDSKDTSLANLHKKVVSKKAGFEGIVFELVDMPAANSLEQRVEEFLCEETELSNDLNELVERVKCLVELAKSDGVRPEASVQSIPYDEPAGIYSNPLIPEESTSTPLPIFSRGAAKTAAEPTVAQPEPSSVQTEQAQPAQRATDVKPKMRSRIAQYFTSNPKLSSILIAIEAEGDRIYFEIKKEAEDRYIMRHVEMKQEYGPEQQYFDLDDVAEAVEKNTNGNYTIVTQREAMRILAMSSTSKQAAGPFPAQLNPPSWIPQSLRPIWRAALERFFEDQGAPFPTKEEVEMVMSSMPSQDIYRTVVRIYKAMLEKASPTESVPYSQKGEGEFSRFTPSEVPPED